MEHDNEQDEEWCADQGLETGVATESVTAARSRPPPRNLFGRPGHLLASSGVLPVLERLAGRAVGIEELFAEADLAPAAAQPPRTLLGALELARGCALPFADRRWELHDEEWLKQIEAEAIIVNSFHLNGRLWRGASARLEISRGIGFKRRCFCVYSLLGWLSIALGRGLSASLTWAPTVVRCPTLQSALFFLATPHLC